MVGRHSVLTALLQPWSCVVTARSITSHRKTTHARRCNLAPVPEVPWLTTAQVAERAGVHPTTILRWARLGVLPPSEIHHGGRRGRVARWSPSTIDQAKWVLAQLEAGYGFNEIKSMLERGEFKADKEGKAT